MKKIASLILAAFALTSVAAFAAEGPKTERPTDIKTPQKKDDKAKTDEHSDKDEHADPKKHPPVPKKKPVQPHH